MSSFAHQDVSPRPLERETSIASPPTPNPALPRDAGPPPRIAIVMPIFNDFVSFEHLCRDLDGLAGDWHMKLSVIGVDDGSIAPLPVRFDPPLRHIQRIDVVRLRCNLGHQRAIAIGLVEVDRRGGFDAALVADSDGEDRPVDFARLIEAHRAYPDHVIVGRRAKRSESLRFRAFYRLYKGLFRLFTGWHINFGNFVLIPGTHVHRLVNMPETWSHVAASILHSRLPRHAVGCMRGRRYAGASSMNLVSLLVHGLSAVAVFSDVVFARMLIASASITAFAMLIAAGAIGVRLLTSLAIPGWTTTVVGTSLILLSEGILFSMTAALMMLRNRSAVGFVPWASAADFIDETTMVFDNAPQTAASHASVR